MSHYRFRKLERSCFPSSAINGPDLLFWNLHWWGHCLALSPSWLFWNIYITFNATHPSHLPLPYHNLMMWRTCHPCLSELTRQSCIDGKSSFASYMDVSPSLLPLLLVFHSPSSVPLGLIYVFTVENNTSSAIFTGITCCCGKHIAFLNPLPLCHHQSLWRVCPCASGQNTGSYPLMMISYLLSL